MMVKKKTIKDPLLGSIVNNYTIVKIIGEGSYGKVYLAMSKNNTLYALKFIFKEEEKYPYETECLKKLCGKYVLCHIDDFYYKSNKIIVTKFLEGYITLYDYLDETEVVDVNKIEKRLKKGLEWIQSKGYTHGDITLTNILINPNTLDIKYIDLGKCKPGISKTDNNRLENVISILKGV